MFKFSQQLLRFHFWRILFFTSVKNWMNVNDEYACKIGTHHLHD